MGGVFRFGRVNNQWSSRGWLPRPGCDSQRKIKLTWFYGGKIEIYLQFLHKAIATKLEIYFFTESSTNKENIYRETSLSWEDIISFPMSKLNFLLLWSLKWIKLTLKFIFLLIKRLYFKSIMWSVWLSIVIIKTILTLSSSATQASRSTGYLSSAVTLADVCLGRLPWETKCGIIQPATPSSPSLSSSPELMLNMMMMSRTRIGRIVVCGLGVGRVEV